MDKPYFILENISLKKYSWFGTGGKAKYFSHLKNQYELIDAVNWSQKNLIDIGILGLGANILISDEGFNGLIIKMPDANKQYRYINEKEGILTVDAGCNLDNIIDYAIKEAFLFGLEEFSGIPSSIGAAVYINIHYYKFLIEQFIESIIVYDIETKSIVTFNRQECQFGYDDSIIKKNKKYIILTVSFILKRGTIEDSWYALGRKKEIIRHRQNRYPHQYTCGCFFKNFDSSNPLLLKNSTNKPITAASYYLDQAGAKNICYFNGAGVSWQHANMIIHSGIASSHDIITVARMMQKIVYQKFNLFLEPECQLLGFSKYPLFLSDTIMNEVV